VGFEKNVLELDIKILAESWTENLIESGIDNLVENWVDNYEQKIDCEI